MNKIFGGIIIVFASIFIVVGAWLAHQQKSKLETYQPVAATVLKTRIDSRSTDDGQTHAPKVEHRYLVDGRWYTNDQVFPLEISSSDRNLALRTINLFSEGEEVTAYYSPSDPSSSFLVRRADFFPYLFLLFPMIFVTVGLTMLTAGIGAASALGEPKPTNRGGYVLQPNLGLGLKLRSSLLITVLWWAMGIFCGVGFRGLDGEITTLPKVVLGIYLVMGLVLAGRLGSTIKLVSQVHDAVVTIDAAKPRLGGSLTVSMEQLIKRGSSINELKVGLLCEMTYLSRNSNGKSSQSTSVVYQESTGSGPSDHARFGREARAGESLRFSTVLTIPADQPATMRGKDYPRHEWFVTVHTDIAHGPDYRERFPIEVLTEGPVS